MLPYVTPNWLLVSMLALPFLLHAPAAPAQWWKRPAPSLCVEQSGYFGCYKTIQDAVDDAKPGATIKIYPGIFFETVEIDTDDITLLGVLPPAYPRHGKSPIIIDALDLPGAAIAIDADDVTIEYLTIRNSTADGIQVDVDNDGDAGARTRITKVTVLGAGDDCIDINRGGDDSVVEYSELVSCDSDGIDLDRLTNNNFATDGPDDVRIRHNKVSAAENGDLIDGDANGTHYLYNTFVRSDNDCIDADGDHIVVKHNNLWNCQESGVEITGDDAHVAWNHVKGTGSGQANEFTEDCSSDGIRVTGQKAKIERNQTTATGGEGIEVDCGAGDCRGATIVYNKVEHVYDVCEGIMATASAGDTDSNIKISYNQISNGMDEGIEINGNGMEVTDNDVIQNGDDNGDDGIEVRGNQNEVAGNYIFRNYDDGIDVEGNLNTIKDNRVKENKEDGIDISMGGRNSVLDNLLWENNRAGIEINAPASQTVVRDNEGADNNVDFCDEGVGTVVGPNVFGTTSNGPCP